MGIVILAVALGKILERSGAVTAACTVFVFTLVGCLAIDALLMYILTNPVPAAGSDFLSLMVIGWIYVTLFNVASLHRIW